jgi:hypothetical protein
MSSRPFVASHANSHRVIAEIAVPPSRLASRIASVAARESLPESPPAKLGRIQQDHFFRILHSLNGTTGDSMSPTIFIRPTINPKRYSRYLLESH